MNKRIRNLFLLLALIAGPGFTLADRMAAQTFTTLHNFTGSSDGATLIGGVILSGNTLYGTAAQRGSSDNGTVFKVNTDGTGFTNLHSFTATAGPYPPTNSDGGFPLAGLILSGNTLYGTTYWGGNSGYGTVFAVNSDGTGFTNLHSFTEDDGAYPRAGLILSGNTLHGTTASGGISGQGTVFAINTDGTGFTNLHCFTAISLSPPYTNSDGCAPYARLLLSGNTLYGTTYGGGSSGNGTLFRINTDGTGFTSLYSFAAGIGSYPNVTNSDGAAPFAGFVLSGNTLYGTAAGGGSSGNGTLFRINTDGTGFTNLYSFTATSVPPPHTNYDGAEPRADLILSGNILYGVAYFGGNSGNGTLFKVNTDGTDFTNLYSFTATAGSVYGNSDGAYPIAGLILSGNTLYGTASFGGSSGYGTLFSLSLGSVTTPQLTIIGLGASVILTWPASATGFTLQSSSDLVSPGGWTTVSPGPVVVDGLNTVTNPIAGNLQFYRLSQ